MGLDVLIVDSSGNQETYYIPLRMMRGEKDNPYPQLSRTVAKDWAWAQPTYELILDMPIADLAGLNIDPSQLMADVDRENNIWQAQ